MKRTLCRLLACIGVTMSTKHRRALRSARTQLLRHMLVTDEFLSLLVSDYVITDTMKEEVDVSITTVSDVILYCTGWTTCSLVVVHGLFVPLTIRTLGLFVYYFVPFWTISFPGRFVPWNRNVPQWLFVPWTIHTGSRVRIVQGTNSPGTVNIVGGQFWGQTAYA